MPHNNKQMASFFLTTKCNLRCKYCYNQEEREKMTEQVLPLHIAKAGVDLFFNTNPSRHIRFYGPGEPTQAFSLMKDITEYARSKAGDKLTTELQTNGCFSKSVKQWILNNLNIVWISFDGEPQIHDQFRPLKNKMPSSPIIEENVKWLIENKGNKNLMVGARMTVTDLTIDRQCETIDYFESLGIKYIWNDPVFPTVGECPVNQCDSINDYHFDIDKYADKYIEAYLYAKRKGIFYGSFLTCNFDGTCKTHCRACTPTPHFTTDGYISACDLVTFGENPKHMSCFVYGKWNEQYQKFDIDNSKVKKLQERTTDNMIHCLNCSVKEHCGGYCLGEIQNETGKLTGQKPNTCRAIRKIAEAIGFSDERYDYLHP